MTGRKSRGKEREIEVALRPHRLQHADRHHHDVSASHDRESSDRASQPHESRNEAAQSGASASRELLVDREQSGSQDLSMSRETPESSDSSDDSGTRSLPLGGQRRVRWSIGDRPIRVSRTPSGSRGLSVGAESSSSETVNSISEESSSLSNRSSHQESPSQLSAKSSSSSVCNNVELPEISAQSVDHIQLHRRWSLDAGLVQRRTVSQAGLEPWISQHVTPQLHRRNSEDTTTFMQSMGRRVCSLLGAQDLFDQIMGSRAVQFIPFRFAWFPIMVAILYMSVLLLILASRLWSCGCPTIFYKT